jgi:hypothetical protein
MGAGALNAVIKCGIADSEAGGAKPADKAFARKRSVFDVWQ